MFKIVIGILCSFLFLIDVFAVDAQKSTEEMVKQAWQEYSFMEFSKSYNMFLKIANSSKDKKMVSEAKTGMAFYYQFSKRGNASEADYKAAIVLYDECITDMGDKSKQVPYWYALKAECFYRLYQINKDRKDLKEAQALWSLLDEKYSSTIAAQDALLFRAIIPIRDYNKKEAKEILSPMIKYINNKETPQVLQSVMANSIANVFYWRNDYKNAFKYYERYLDFGATNKTFKINTYFKLARIADLKLGNSAGAIKYYELLKKEAPTNNKAYFSGVRANEIKNKQ